MNTYDFERVKRRLVVDPATGCWNWPGAKSNFGHGRVKIDGKLHLPHRVMFESVHGPIPKRDANGRKLIVCHKCDNPACANPAHLELGNYSKNMLDCVDRGRWRNPKTKKIMAASEIKTRNYINRPGRRPYQTRARPQPLADNQVRTWHKPERLLTMRCVLKRQQSRPSADQLQLAIPLPSSEGHEG
jgi:hypothetical protein